MTILDGKALAEKVKAEVRAEAERLKAGLAVVLVGEDPASQIYVRGKERDCGECGIQSFSHRIPAETTQAELLALLAELNDDPKIDGSLERGKDDPWAGRVPALHPGGRDGAFGRV